MKNFSFLLVAGLSMAAHDDDTAKLADRFAPALQQAGVVTIPPGDGPLYGRVPSSRGRSPWIVAPWRIGELTDRDRTARQELVKRIDAKQQEGFRRYYRVTVAEMPSGLPDDYDILIYGHYVGIVLLRLEVKVRGRRAIGEMVTVDGFRQGELPAREIDGLALQAVYAFQAEQTTRSQERRSDRPPVYATFATNTRRQRLEIISRDGMMPLHLQTEAWQATADTVSTYTCGVRGFAHTQLCRNAELLARQQLTLQEPSPELGREVVARLRRIQIGQAPTPDDTRKQALPLDHYSKDDLPSIEAQLYSRLAVEWSLDEALPELRRLKLDDTATRLEIAIADDPIPALQAALTGDDFGIFRWSLDFASRLPAPQQRAVLLYALTRVPDGFRLGTVLEQLRKLPAGDEGVDAVEKFYAASDNQRAKIAAAGFLLDKSGQDTYYESLKDEALRPQEKPEDIYATQRDAVRAIIRYASEHNRKRQETVAVIRTLLQRIPMDAHADYSGMRTLVSALGELGERSDLPLLETYCDHDDASMVDSAIHAIARIEPQLALEKAQVQIRRYLDGSGRNPSFRWYVFSYLDLFFWQDDRSAMELLEQALEKYRGETRDDDAYVTHTPLLLDYLQADDVPNRTKAALAYAKVSRVNPSWLHDVGQQLVDSGADAQQCAPLLEPDPDHWSKRWGSSREGRPW